MSGEWWRGAVIYQIYPRSFQDSDASGVGDIPGIIRRLDHIASLGVDAIWLSPIFTSPMKDMGYDVSDYVGVDPMFGTLDDFDQMVERAHELGLKVIVDQVYNHTSDKHAWFEESRRDPNGDKADWYHWEKAKPDGSPPNNWLSVFGGPAWTWDAHRRRYYLHNFLPSQPDLNFREPAVQEAILDVMRFWLDRGVDGFRLDTVNYYAKDDQLRDNPPREGCVPEDYSNPLNVQNQIYNKNREDNLAFVEKMRSVTDEYENRCMVGEVGESGRRSIEIMEQYTTGDDRLHMAYSFELLDEHLSASHIRNAVEGFFEGAPDGWPCWAFSNHDVVRHATRWAEHGTDTDSIARQFATLLMTLRGTICLYQGEELGQTETEMEFHELTDPPGIAFWPDHKGRDGCRTPMVWDDTEHAGFTDGTPWLPVKDPQKERNVAAQEAANDSVLGFYREMLTFRKNCPSMTQEIAFLDLPEPVLGYTRGSGDDLMLCLFNLSTDAITLNVSGGTFDGPNQGAELSGTQLRLDGSGFAMLTETDGTASIR